MIVNAEKAPKEIVTTNNIANGVIASELNNAVLGSLIPKKRCKALVYLRSPPKNTNECMYWSVSSTPAGY